MQAIFIDAGHSTNPLHLSIGASHVMNGKRYTERSINKEIARRVIEILEKKLPDTLIQGVGVETEASNSKKMKYVNEVMKINGLTDCIGVSLHCNGNYNLSGCMAFYQTKNNHRMIGDYILDAINKYFGRKIERNIPSNKSRFKGLYIDNAKCPYVLIEMGYIWGDLHLLLDYDRTAESVAHGIMNYIRAL